MYLCRLSLNKLLNDRIIRAVFLKVLSVLTQFRISPNSKKKVMNKRSILKTASLEFSYTEKIAYLNQSAEIHSVSSSSIYNYACSITFKRIMRFIFRLALFFFLFFFLFFYSQFNT